MKYDILFVGPGCIDENTDYTKETIKSAGGAVWFALYAARAAGARAAGAIKMKASDRAVYGSDFDGFDVMYLDSKASTAMCNIYYDETREKRKSSVKSQADTITADEIPPGEYGLCHLGGLLFGDFDGSFIEQMSKRCPLSADMQGFLRCEDHGGLTFRDWQDKKKYLRYFKYLKVDANEAQIMTGLTDHRDAAMQLFSWGAKKVLLSYNEEMLVYDGTSFSTAPVRARNLSGRTGRGDTVFASYLAKREDGVSAAEALRYATALVSLKMETPGPFKGTDADVREFLRKYY